MRAFAALWLVGCASHHEPSAADAPEATPDVAQPTCSSAAGTANVVVHTATAQAYDHAFAGAIKGPNTTSLKLVFAQESPISVCCASQLDMGCCGIFDVLRAEVDALDPGAELGGHPATVSGAGFSGPGTLTITDWVQPFDTPPGHVAGSVSVSIGSVTIDGTFDDTFCADLLGVPI